jgi:transposase
LDPTGADSRSSGSAAHADGIEQGTHATEEPHSCDLGQYAISIEGASDLFGKRGREELQKSLGLLPEHSRFAVERLLETLELVQKQIDLFEQRMKETFAASRQLKLLQTLPGVGFILAVVIFLEVGDIGRFPGASRFVAYSGTTPRVISSGGKTRYGQLWPDVNRYLKWAFIEAANVICLHHRLRPYRHVSRLYLRVRQRKGHQKAVGAVARHLAEDTYWILKKGEGYQEPRKQAVSSTKG